MKYPDRSNIDTIIIVMPHTVCDKSVINCEIYLLSFVDEIKRRLSHSNLKIYSIPSYQNRYILDDNRIIPKDKNTTILNSSQLWKELRELFESNIPNLKKVCIFNLHTFYGNSFTSGGKQNIDIAILDNNPRQPLSIKIIDFFTKCGYNTNLVNGKFGYNALLDIFTIHPVYIPSILIEVKKDIILDVNSQSYSKLVDDFVSLIYYITTITKRYKLTNN